MKLEGNGPNQLSLIQIATFFGKNWKTQEQFVHLQRAPSTDQSRYLPHM